VRGSACPANRCASFERNALLQQARDRGHVEGVQGEIVREGGVLQPPIHHAEDVVDVNAACGELAPFTEDGRKESGILRKTSLRSAALRKSKRIPSGRGGRFSRATCLPSVRSRVDWSPAL
jgi:hypothetical protein